MVEHQAETEVEDRVLNILEGVKRRIADPKNWTKYQLAKTARGEVISSSSPRATKWCIRGATMAECGVEYPYFESSKHYLEVDRLLNWTAKKLCWSGVLEAELYGDYDHHIALNNVGEHHHVMGLLDWAMCVRRHELGYGFEKKENT